MKRDRSADPDRRRVRFSQTEQQVALRAVVLEPMAGKGSSERISAHLSEIAIDAEAVRRLKAAGAIVLGKTSCSDMSASAETTNPIIGLTRNPWNLDHSAGGSSGGEAALIAAGGSPLGLGADFGGSIRIPAAFCGVIGFPTDGHMPPTPHISSDWNTVGPIARHVLDITLALSVLSNTPMTACSSVNLRGRRLLLPRFLLSQPVSRDIAGGVKTAAIALRETGND